MKTDKLFFSDRSVVRCPFNFYANDWSIVPYPTLPKVVYAVEAHSGAVKIIYSTKYGSTIRSIGFSDGDKLDAGEKVQIQLQENWSMD